MQINNRCACEESGCMKPQNKETKGKQISRGFSQRHALQVTRTRLCSEAGSCYHWRRPVVTHEWLVVAGGRVRAMVHLPARVTVVAETGEVAAEVRSRLARAHVTHRLLQIRVNLDLCTRSTARHSLAHFVFAECEWVSRFLTAPSVQSRLFDASIR